LSSVEIKSVDEAQIRQCIDEYAAALLSAHPEIKEVVVFGSFLTGTFVPGSDVDVFILLSDCDRPVRDRIPDFLPPHFPIGVDVFPYTAAEVATMEDSPVIKAVRQSPWRYRRTPGLPGDASRHTPDA
jgi:predicted nucleotidyltransferase